MANTLRIKRSSTANATPTGLQAGELAANTTDKTLFIGDGTNTQELTRRAASSTAGRVQLAASTGALTDSGGLHFDSTNNTLTVNTVLVQSTSTEGVVINNANPSKPMVLTHSNMADGGKIIIGDYFEDGNGTTITVNDETTEVGIQGTLVSLEGMQTVQLQLLDGDYSHSVNLAAPLTVAATYTLTLPATAGSNGQVLTTNGTGTLSWTTPSGGSGSSTPDFLLISAGII